MCILGVRIGAKARPNKSRSPASFARRSGGNAAVIDCDRGSTGGSVICGNAPAATRSLRPLRASLPSPRRPPRWLSKRRAIGARAASRRSSGRLRCRHHRLLLPVPAFAPGRANAIERGLCRLRRARIGDPASCARGTVDISSNAALMPSGAEEIPPSPGSLHSPRATGQVTSAHLVVRKGPKPRDRAGVVEVLAPACGSSASARVASHRRLAVRLASGLRWPRVSAAVPRILDYAQPLCFTSSRLDSSPARQAQANRWRCARPRATPPSHRRAYPPPPAPSPLAAPSATVTRHPSARPSTHAVGRRRVG